VNDTPSPSWWQQVQAVLDQTLVCLDFDGTLSPIVDDPASAKIHPEGPGALRELAPRVLAVAVVTGRPVRQVLDLGELEALADAVGTTGRVEVRGQYGNERWSSTERRVHEPEPPQELVALRDRLPGLLERADLAHAYVEEKGLAVAVHTRRLADADAAARRALEVLGPVGDELGLRVEPGRRVVEVRASGADKATAVEQLVHELDPAAVVFAGDDLGDLAAYDAVTRFREAGGVGLLICSGSTEQTALAEKADLVVDGPDGVTAALAALARGSAPPE
jgi:trehalose 6-phosphate phosphatase